MTNLRLEYRRASDLTANPRNWRRHPAHQETAMRDILDRLGWAGAIIYNERTGHIIDGHLRAELSGTDSVPVLIGSWSESEEGQILATYDAVTLAATVDSEGYTDLLADIGAISPSVDALLESVANDYRAIEIMADPTPEDESYDTDGALTTAEADDYVPFSKRGQIWRLGRHRLMCGDSTAEGDVAALLGEAAPLLMVTDPPYGVNYDPKWRNEAAEKGHLAYAARRVGKVVNDDRVDWSEAYSLFPGDVMYAWSPGGDHVILTGQAVQSVGFMIRNQIMWRKPHFPISRGAYTYQHEPCWYAVRKGAKAHWIGPANASTVWDITLDRNVEGGHSTQKPLECMARPIEYHEGDVYDPFVGSGTTIIAAEKLNRICYAMEIEPRYVDVAIRRWEGYTGEKAVLTNG